MAHEFFYEQVFVALKIPAGSGTAKGLSDLLNISSRRVNFLGGSGGATVNMF